jgi:hypothetical protein
MIPDLPIGFIFIRRLTEMPGETNQRTPCDPYYWEKLSKLHPTDVCNRTEAIYNPAQEGFVLPVYNLRYLILPKTKRILRVESNDQPVDEELPAFFYLMVLAYLTEAKEIKTTHTWISEKDLKGHLFPGSAWPSDRRTGESLWEKSRGLS